MSRAAEYPGKVATFYEFAGFELDNTIKKKARYSKFSGFAGYAALITAASFWGASGVFVKLITANEVVSATALAFWRDFATFLCLLLLGLATIPARLRIERSDWRYMVGIGASLGVFHIFYNLSVMVNGAAVTTVQQALMPAIVAAAAWYLWREEFSGRKALAIVLAFAGAVLVAGPAEIKDSGFTLQGLLVGFCVPCFYAAWNLFGKRARMQYDALVVLIFAFGIASAMLLPLQFFIPQPWPIQPISWLWFAGLIGLSTVSAFFLYAVGIGRLQAGIASILLMSEIAFGVFYAYLLLNERLVITQITGSILVIAGVLQLMGKN